MHPATKAEATVELQWTYMHLSPTNQCLAT